MNGKNTTILLLLLISINLPCSFSKATEETYDHLLIHLPDALYSDIVFKNNLIPEHPINLNRTFMNMPEIVYFLRKVDLEFDSILMARMMKDVDLKIFKDHAAMKKYTFTKEIKSIEFARGENAGGLNTWDKDGWYKFAIRGERLYVLTGQFNEEIIKGWMDKGLCVLNEEVKINSTVYQFDYSDMGFDRGLCFYLPDPSTMVFARSTDTLMKMIHASTGEGLNMLGGDDYTNLKEVSSYLRGNWSYTNLVSYYLPCLDKWREVKGSDDTFPMPESVMQKEEVYSVLATHYDDGKKFFDISVYGSDEIAKTE